MLSADSRAEVSLHEELLSIQERWRHANICLEEQKRELAVLLRVQQIIVLLFYFIRLLHCREIFIDDCKLQSFFCLGMQFMEIISRKKLTK